jgi:hypothetical protein
MKLRDFAERVLFVTTLEDKLQSPANVTDNSPGSPLLAPCAPGRPAECVSNLKVPAKRISCHAIGLLGLD